MIFWSSCMKGFWIGLIWVGVWLGGAPVELQAKERGLWVTRWDYKSATDVIQIMENAKSLGCNRVYFQVRGNATVCYPSAIEPWAWELTSNNANTLGQDPGWDPLAVAVEQAKTLEIEIHAWMNVFPAWRGTVPAPKGSDHVWATKRSWFMVDHLGNLLRPTQTFYAFLSPGNPAVRTYLASVFGEIATLYPELDGIHLDYIRYPGRTEVGNFRDFSYDKSSVEAFKKRYQNHPRYDMPEWQQFKCEQVAETIRAIRAAIRIASPTMQLSATCFANINSATEEKGQDPRIWLAENLVDWVIPMAYSRTTGDFETLLSNWEGFFDPGLQERMAIGVNVDFTKLNVIYDQLEIVSRHKYGGAVLFAYAALYNGHLPNDKAAAVQKIWKEERLQEMLMMEPLSSGY